MTPLHQAAQQALDALENSYLSDELRNYELQAKAITALREALSAPEPEPVARVAEVHMSRYTIEWTNGPLPEGTGLYAAPPAAPEPEPVAWLVEGWHDGKLIAHIPHLTLEDAKASAAVFSQHYTTTKLVPLYAAPPAAPADDHATPSGGQEAGPQEDRIEAAYWRFDARHKGYSQWKTAPMSERDAFKAEMRNALEAEKVRAEMRLVARGWRRPDAPAAPDHLRDVAEKAAPTAPVVREPQPEPVQRLMRFAGKKRSEVSNPCLTAREAIVIADWMQAHGITGASK